MTAADRYARAHEPPKKQSPVNSLCRSVAVACLILLAAVSGALAQPAPGSDAPPRSVVIGTKFAPPFAMKDAGRRLDRHQHRVVEARSPTNCNLRVMFH